MATTTVEKIQLRRDTAVNWTTANPTLSAGELGIETDTGKFKIGNGTTAWTSLGYAALIPNVAALVNADVSPSAAIAYSKLNLAGSILNADIAAAAAIVDTKLATISTAGKVSGTAITSGDISSSGGLRHTGTVGVGYNTGAGGTVTQATSRTTGVTLSKLSGAITLFSTTTTAGQVTTFTVTNTLVAASDTVIVTQQTGAGVYFFSTKAAAGSFNISVQTPAAVGTAEAPVINFAVIKSVSA